MRWWAVETTTIGTESVDGRSGEPDRPTGVSGPGGVGGFDDAVLWAALRSAVRAPSIHNSQPWRWRIRPHGVDRTRIRTDGFRTPIPTAATR